MCDEQTRRRLSAGGKGAGRAYVYSGRVGRVLLTLTGERAGDAFGSVAASAPGTGPERPSAKRPTPSPLWSANPAAPCESCKTAK